jgi:hypothetical protein
VPQYNLNFLPFLAKFYGIRNNMEQNAFVDFKISANRLRVVLDLVFYFNFQLFIFDVDLKTTKKFGNEFLE